MEKKEFHVHTNTRIHFEYESINRQVLELKLEETLHKIYWKKKNNNTSKQASTQNQAACIEQIWFIFFPSFLLSTFVLLSVHFIVFYRRQPSKLVFLEWVSCLLLPFFTCFSLLFYFFVFYYWVYLNFNGFSMYYRLAYVSLKSHTKVLISVQTSISLEFVDSKSLLLPWYFAVHFSNDATHVLPFFFHLLQTLGF